MTRRKRDIPIQEPAAPEPIEEPAAETEMEASAHGEEGAVSEAVATQSEAEELAEELQLVQDRHLRLQAEFDNFKKREARERAGAWGRAKADLLQKLLGPLDDLRRVARLDPDLTATPAVLQGLKLVERKFHEALEREGVTTTGQVGEVFDPNLHEAIGMWPAPEADAVGRVAAVTAPGYTFGSQLLRPAQVQVYEDRSAASPSA